MDKWFKLLNEARKKGSRREPTPFKSKAQRRYKSQRRKNDIYSTVSGHKNLSTGAPFTNKTKRAGTDRLRFEEVEPESFDIKSTLAPKFWTPNKRLKGSISKRLQRIADDFLEGLQVEVTIEELRLTGSLANYNWSKYSDVDLHIVVDFDKMGAGDVEMIRSFFDMARIKWNTDHDIMIYGHEVEIYVEDVGHQTISSGIYSVTEADWITEPSPGDQEIDIATARKKSDDIQTKINLISRYVDKKPKSALKSINKLKEKIRRMRKTGLRSDRGEYSSENIAFKILRREDALEKLSNLKKKAYDSYMSMEF
jgi:hypothetical protein